MAITIPINRILNGEKANATVLNRPSNNIISYLQSSQFPVDMADVIQLDASRITSGTINRNRLPSGNTGQSGIVQLYNGLDSTSTVLGLTANAGRLLNNSKLDSSDFPFNQSQNGSITLPGGLKLIWGRTTFNERTIPRQDDGMVWRLNVPLHSGAFNSQIVYANAIGLRSTPTPPEGDEMVFSIINMNRLEINFRVMRIIGVNSGNELSTALWFALGY